MLGTASPPEICSVRRKKRMTRSYKSAAVHIGLAVLGSLSAGFLLAGGIGFLTSGVFDHGVFIGDPCEYHLGKDLGPIVRHFYSVGFWDFHPTPNLRYFLLWVMLGLAIGIPLHRQLTRRRNDPSNNELHVTNQGAP